MNFVGISYMELNQLISCNQYKICYEISVLSVWQNIAVSEVAEKVIWSSLVEDPALFLRTFLEKLTNRDKQVMR